MPQCTVVLVEGERILAEICHIRARRKNGPRFDPALSAEERDSFGNLLLLCPTCHTLADKDPIGFPIDRLLRIKARHEEQGSLELTGEVAAQALRIFARLHERRTVKASAQNGGIAVSVGGDNHAPININQRNSRKSDGAGFPPNSIGADANLSNYIEYLCGLWVDYTAQVFPDENVRWAMIGTAIKRKFRLKKRKRGHISAERFRDLTLFLIEEKLAKTPVGRKHLKNGDRLCRTFDEFRHGVM